MNRAASAVLSWVSPFPVAYRIGAAVRDRRAGLRAGLVAAIVSGVASRVAEALERRGATGSV